MKFIYQLIFTLSLACFSLSTLAHSGHDHNHWSSPALHTLFYVSLGAALGAIAFLVFKKLTRTKHATKQ